MKKLLFVLALLFAAIPARAATYTAASCSRTDIAAAFTAEQVSPVNGDIIAIPTGSCTAAQWTSTLNETITVTVTIQGNTTISGGGLNCGTPPTYDTACTATDNTILTDGVASGSPMLALSLNGSGTQEVRLTGVTIDGNAGSITVYNGVITVQGSNASAQFRFDHSHLKNYYQSGFRIFQPAAYGVFDHNVFDASSSIANAIQIWQGDNGKAAWAAATGFGGADFTFIENNTFNNQFANDCDGGGRYVFRYNVFIASANAGVQSHATGSVGFGTRGCRAEEVYENYVRGSGTVFTFEFQTSGPSLSWGNNSSGYPHVIDLVSDRDDGSSNYSYAAPPYGIGFCGTYKTGVTSAWDGNVTTAGWPCQDQTGRGEADQISIPTGAWSAKWQASTNCNGAPWYGYLSDPGNHVQKCTGVGSTGSSAPSFNDSGGTTSDGGATWTDQGLNVVNTTTSTVAWPHQYLEPVYSWEETYSLPGGGTFLGLQSVENNIQQNRDVYIQAGSTAQTTSSSPFSGTTGTGWGTLANRPTTCTAGAGGTYATSPTGSYGVAYFATDQNGGIGELYICTTTNTWTASYEPYTYPHPLVGGTPQALAPTGSPTSGAVPQTVTVTNPNSGTTDVCYAASPTVPATDGTGTGCTTGTKYTAPISVTVAETLNLIAGVSGDTDSPLTQYVYSAAAVAPTVTTTAASNVTVAGATAGGVVTANGGASVTSEGTCYALTANPTTPCTSDGTATPFTSTITGLGSNTTYHYRAFAANSAGTGYGGDLTFQTLSVCTTPVAVGAFTYCNQGYVDIYSNTAVSLSASPYAGNGVEIIGTWCENAGCSSAPAETATISDNLNSPETCFTASPNSPYNFANTTVPDYGRIYAWYCPSIPAGVTSFTMTVSGTVLYPQFAWIEWLSRPIAPSSYFEIVDALGASGGTAGTTASVSTSATTVHASDLVTAWIANCGASISATVGTGYTGIVVNPFGTPGTIVEAKGVTSVGTQTATTTWSSGTAGSNCQLGAGDSNDTWWGVIVPLISGGGSQIMGGVKITGGVTIQ